jgi:murein DD-endopeptidase MepM/ murein hydrolase activator NlpD
MKRIPRAPSKFLTGKGRGSYNNGAMRKIGWISAVIAYLSIFIIEAAACDPGRLKIAITDTSKTIIRKGNGEFGAPRSNGGVHQGVDIITNASYSSSEPYAVFSIAAGTVASSRLNGTPTTGYGNVIVVDHGNDCYSLYAHLANLPFTPISPGGNLLKKIGDKLKTGDVLGHFVDIKAEMESTGNAVSTAPEARHQVHFELIRAPSGRSGTGGLNATILRSDGVREDPASILISLGYKIL